jgi:hypothetical protein
VQGVVFPGVNILSGIVSGSALAYDDVTGYGLLPAEDLYAQSFRFGLPSVLRTTYSFFMSHLVSVLGDYLLKASINSAFFMEE